MSYSMRLNWVFFYRYIGKWAYVFIGVCLLASLLNGLGVSCVVPLLDFVGENQLVSISGSFFLSEFIRTTFDFLGVKISLFSILFFVSSVFFVKAIVLFFQVVCRCFVLQTFSKTLRLDLLNQFKSVSYEYFVTKNAGDLNNAFVTEVMRSESCLNSFVDMVVYSFNCIAYLLFSFFINWRFSLGALFLGAVVYFCFRGLSYHVTRLSTLFAQKNSRVQSLILRVIHNFKYLKATSSFEQILLHLSDAIEDRKILAIKMQSVNAVVLSVMEPIAVIILCVFLFYYMGIRGDSFSSLIVPALFLYRILGQLFSLQKKYQLYCSTLGSVNVVKGIRDDFLLNKEQFFNKKEIESFNDELSLHNLSFKYGDKSILCGVDLTIKKKQTIAIVGPSGAGKSTLINLIVGLLKNDSGDISIDGIKYDDIDINSLRTLFGYVTQEPVVFDDTIANNLSLWDGSLVNNKNALDYALRVSCFDEVVNTTDKGLDSSVGNQGVSLSGGQVQRLSIAREILRNRPIIVFDEATSSLDSRSEGIIQECMTNLLHNKTVIIISHRFSTIKNADYIYFMKDGRIVEEGSWTELVSAKGEFYESWNRQRI